MSNPPQNNPSEETRAFLARQPPGAVFQCMLDIFRFYNIGDRMPRGKLNFATLTDEDYVHFTRFTSGNIRTITTLLEMPEKIIGPTGLEFTREEAFFFLCARLAWPTRMKTLEFTFGYDVALISEAMNWALQHIVDHWDFLLDDFESGHLSEDRLALFASKIHAKDSPLDKCWGFIDCTIRKVCPQVEWEKEEYRMNTYLHRYKYQAVKSPDGLIYHLFGPEDGSPRTLLRESRLLDRCEDNAPSYYMAMRSCHECVGWGFADVLRLWTALDFKTTQQLFGDVDVGSHYRVAVILTNFHICLYGSSTSTFFNCDPPTLEEYLG
ncbi:uncharacterized protein H6S33_004718 [Morchella sextelata]|uniref:uncharacterized protein n=1 Tax=Morchella sextelata TaxID=1174677 RepID=UPI001D040183|nr:uncharacterized protein H6S33_004718 [Morchella sextelata]KAH0605496.1 hypothetical protein H6S33_004718 [Morchella sextelata]